MKREIGSEYWDIPIKRATCSLFPNNTHWFLSGRSALEAIIKENDFHTAALPSWCCDSMILPFLKNRIEVKFYPVYMTDNGLVQDLSRALDNDAIFLMDYFGYTSTCNITNYSCTAIRDVTHSVFSASYTDADYYFGSLRKWAGFWTGGYAKGLKMEPLGTDENYVVLRKSAMEAKAKYICGASDNKEYLKTFEEAEKYLENCKIADAYPRDVELAQQLDVEGIKDQRRKNARILLNEFADIAIFPTLNDTDCPMFVPILVPHGKRNDLKRYLIEHEIYCPVHWPVSKYHNLIDQTKQIYDEELSLVCDQRYAEEDMYRMIGIIKDFRKGI